MMKAHIATKGKHEGDYVKCPAQIMCRVAPAAAHADFKGEKEMNAYNDLMHSAPEFSENSCMPGLFGGDPLANRDIDDNSWAMTDEFGHTGIPSDGDMGAVALTANDFQDEMYDLRSGTGLDTEHHEELMENAHAASNAIWGGNEGMSESKPSDVGLGGGGNAHLGAGWSRRMGAESKSIDEDYGTVSTPYYDVFSDGRTAVSVVTSADGRTRRMSSMSRNHQNVVVTKDVEEGAGISLDGYDSTGAPLDEVHDAISGKLGTDDFMFSMDLSEDGSPYMRLMWSKDGKDDSKDYHNADDFLKNFPDAGDALGKLEVKGA